MNDKSIFKKKPLKIFTDGAARGNPGPAAISFIIIQDDNIIQKGTEYIGKATNNTAEYKAIILGLETAKNYTNDFVQVYSDSNLAIQQIEGNWKINYPHLLELYEKVNKLKRSFKKVEFFHVRRDNEFIEECDKACNTILDEK